MRVALGDKVPVSVGEAVYVAVNVPVTDDVTEDVIVCEGVRLGVLVSVGVSDSEGVMVAVNVTLGVNVTVGVRVAVGVNAMIVCMALVWVKAACAVRVPAIDVMAAKRARLVASRLTSSVTVGTPFGVAVSCTPLDNAVFDVNRLTSRINTAKITINPPIIVNGEPADRRETGLTDPLFAGNERDGGTAEGGDMGSCPYNNSHCWCNPTANA